MAYIMDTFCIVRRKDEEKYGKYSTKRVILEIYDEMAEGTGKKRPHKCNELARSGLEDEDRYVNAIRI